MVQAFTTWDQKRGLSGLRDVPASEVRYRLPTGEFSTVNCDTCSPYTIQSTQIGQCEGTPDGEYTFGTCRNGQLVKGGALPAQQFVLNPSVQQPSAQPSKCLFGSSYFPNPGAACETGYTEVRPNILGIPTGQRHCDCGSPSGTQTPINPAGSGGGGTQTQNPASNPCPKGTSYDTSHFVGDLDPALCDSGYYGTNPGILSPQRCICSNASASEQSAASGETGAGGLLQNIGSYLTIIIVLGILSAVLGIFKR